MQTGSEMKNESQSVMEYGCMVKALYFCLSPVVFDIWIFQVAGMRFELLNSRKSTSGLLIFPNYIIQADKEQKTRLPTHVERMQAKALHFPH